MASRVDEAYLEALASNPEGDVLLETLELWGSEQGRGGIGEEDGRVYVVNDYTPLSAHIDVGGGIVGAITYRPCSFSIKLTSTKDISRFTLTIDNVDKIILDEVEKLVRGNEVIKTTYREYLNNKKASDQNLPVYELKGYQIIEVSFNLEQITATGEIWKLVNQSFPIHIYTLKDYPMLDFG